MGNKMMERGAKMAASSRELRPDLLFISFTIVNACLVGEPGADSKWMLVDTGLEDSADFILECAEKRFGQDSKPQCIILTHGHFDHVGSVIKLSEFWDVPVYIHPLEMPYVTGERDYPLADPIVDGGLTVKMLPTFSHTSIDLGFRAMELPDDGNVPGMSEWKWIHTPGHTEGHISLFRKRDRVLLVGDACWEAAENSVILLKDLYPFIAVPSHGEPLAGAEFTQQMDMLVSNFHARAKPAHNKFV